MNERNNFAHTLEYMTSYSQIPYLTIGPPNWLVISISSLILFFRVSSHFVLLSVYVVLYIVRCIVVELIICFKLLSKSKGNVAVFDRCATSVCVCVSVCFLTSSDRSKPCPLACNALSILPKMLWH